MHIASVKYSLFLALFFLRKKTTIVLSLFFCTKSAYRIVEKRQNYILAVLDDDAFSLSKIVQTETLLNFG